MKVKREKRHVSRKNVSFLYLFLCRTQSDHAKIKEQKKLRHQGGEENAFVGHEDLQAVVTHHRFGVSQHPCANGGADHTGNQYLRHDAQALEHPRLVFGRSVSDDGTEHGGAGQVAAHHGKRAKEDEGGMTEKEQKKIADNMQTC